MINCPLIKTGKVYVTSILIIFKFKKMKKQNKRRLPARKKVKNPVQVPREKIKKARLTNYIKRLEYFKMFFQKFRFFQKVFQIFTLLKFTTDVTGIWENLKTFFSFVSHLLI